MSALGQKRTFAMQLAMSAMGQKRTFKVSANLSWRRSCVRFFFFPTFDGGGQRRTERMVHLAQSLSISSILRYFPLGQRFADFGATRHDTPHDNVGFVSERWPALKFDVCSVSFDLDQMFLSKAKSTTHSQFFSVHYTPKAKVVLQ
jgi:hypothetical protein